MIIDIIAIIIILFSAVILHECAHGWMAYRLGDPTAKQAGRLTLNPLKTVTTVTVQIVTLLVGDQEFDSPKTLAAFALGLALFIATLALNIIALHVVRKYREQYE